MLSGRDSFQVINQRLVGVQQEIDAVHRRMEEVSRRIDDIRGRTAEQYRQLAEFKLDEITARPVVDSLGEAERAVEALLNEKAAAVGDLEAGIDASAAKLKHLAAERDGREKDRDLALEALEARIAEVLEKLRQQESYRAQSEACRNAAEKAENAEQKAAQAEQDRVSKGKPYEADSLFMYLWARRYGTGDYDAGGLFRTLDNWVAGLIDYENARRNYFMLSELPVRLKEHAARLRAAADREGQALASIEAEAARAEGVSELQTAFEARQDALRRLDEEMESAETHHGALVDRRTLFASGDDEFSRQSLALLTDRLKQKPFADLHREALGTDSPTDDVIVARIRELNRDSLDAQAQLEALKGQAQKNRDALAELEELRQWFRRQNYDSQYSRFPAGFTLAVLLEELLRGRTSGGDLRDRIRRNQRFHLPGGRKGRPWGGGFGGGFGGGGGGGFGTGGGFGGGGGFRTGGGF